jgi:riboflavin kinase/FMN adenylyltransferase
MLLVHSYLAPPAGAAGAVAVIGNFDGVHLGHRHILDRARKLAKAKAAPLAALVFEPHPRQFFVPQSAPFRLTTLRSKLGLLEACGVDAVIALRFDQALAAMPAEDFIAKVLVEGLQVRHVVVGHDFAFGRGRAGTTETLSRGGDRFGFGVDVVAAVKSGTEIFSSNRIRASLRDGAVGQAAQQLGHWWEVNLRVRRGDARGRKLGFPTANLELGRLIAPRAGVYAVRVRTGSENDQVWHDGVANFGVRPTVGGVRELLEVHLLGFSGDLYRRHLRVAFVDFIRPEMKFPGLDSLRRQIGADSDAARAILADPANRADRFPPLGQALI